MRISDWSSDVCSSDLEVLASMGNYIFNADALIEAVQVDGESPTSNHDMGGDIVPYFVGRGEAAVYDFKRNDVPGSTDRDRAYWRDRSEEHTSELQSLMRISYAVFCFKKKN